MNINKIRQLLIFAFLNKFFYFTALFVIAFLFLYDIISLELSFEF